ncbi:MAG TPA: respiratory nitrate reductase subunit gamma [Thermoanaerobaculia bacterium]|jgi:nitrate reductase gamma subunit|nr:respiratory nitrate reductase subunit gamma [Thermoanaerobaculia bacterium]
MRDFFLFGLAPYVAAACLLGALVWRTLSPRARKALPEVCRESAALYRGAMLWRWGLGLLLLGHAVAFLMPRSLLLWDRSPLRLVLLEGAAFLAGLAGLAGLALLLRRSGRLRKSTADLLLLTLVAVVMVSGLAMAVLYRWGSQWYALSLLPWFRSLLALRPDVSHVAPLPPLVRLHVLAGMAAAGVLPFTRAFYALAWPAVLLGERIGTLRASRSIAAAEAMAALALAVFSGMLLMGALRRVGVSQGYAPAQPIAFSHRLHAGKYRVPCLYCHFAAETSRHAGIPPAGICMNCHGQLKVASAEVQKLKEAVAQRRRLRWTKVHNLPDFVYFSHSQHVRGGGVACQRCHGPVEAMERVSQTALLTMGWCLDCHRKEGIMPASQRTAKGRASAATGGLDCGKCHY